MNSMTVYAIKYGDKYITFNGNGWARMVDSGPKITSFLETEEQAKQEIKLLQTLKLWQEKEFTIVKFNIYNS